MGSRSNSSTFSLTSALSGGGGVGQRHIMAALPQGKARCQLYRGMRGSRASMDGLRKSHHRTDGRSPDRPACSESLYWLSYPGRQRREGERSISCWTKGHKRGLIKWVVIKVARQRQFSSGSVAVR